MLHCSGNYTGVAEAISSPTFGPSAGYGGPAPMNLNASVRISMFDQVQQIKQSLVATIHDDLVDKVEDRVVERLLKITEQLEALVSKPSENRVSIALPPLPPPKPTESPTTQPFSARVRSMDLNDIPTYKVDNNNTSYQPTSGEVSPVSQPLLQKRKSVVFFSQDQPPSDDEGHKFVARSYSGFGSFRRASRHASTLGGGLQQLHHRALSFIGDGMPAFDLNEGTGNSIRSRFSRPIARHTEAFSDASVVDFVDACEGICSVLDIDVDDTDVNLLLLEVEEADILRSVAVRVFSQYRCMQSDKIDVPIFLQFIDAVSRYNNVTNPFRNGLHTSETLMGVHQYLRQPDVGNNFSDDEITSLLIAALCINLGHLGVTNEFLLQLHHPLSRVFSIVGTAESVATMIGLQLLEQYNFLSPTCSTSDVYWLGLQEGIADLLSSTSPRLHQHQLRQALSMTERGFVSDADVPMLLSCVLRASTMRFCCKPKQQHVRYAELWVNEAYKQSECERILEFSSQPQWTNDTAWASVQAYVTVVAVPYFAALQEFFPEVWGSNLERVQSLYGSPDSPISNTKASFRDGMALLSIEIDPNVPEWSDQSSLTLNILTTIIPQHLIMNTTAGRVGTASRSRMDHYYSFLQLYDRCERDAIRASDFGGSLVQLAMQLDPLYIGEYATALVDESDWNTFADAAATILKTEAAPDTTSVMSPGRRTYQSTDAFVVLLLRMMGERVGLQQPSPSNCTSISGGSNSGDGMPSLTAAGRSSITGSSGGPFRGKWRLLPNNSVYDQRK